MKKRNGFTLIELLAVIVILAVIALIAVPRIIEILNKARLSAAEDSTMGIIEAAESYVASFMLQNQGAIPSENLVFECNSEGCFITTNLEGYDTTNLDKLDYKGKNASSGNITISNSGKSIQATNLNINGFTCNYLNDEAYCGKKEYNSGDAYKLGGYDWHVISDDGKYLTLLMDAYQLDSMGHCTDKENCIYYQYSWDKSKIREYLNGEVLTDLENKIGKNKLMTTDICIDQSIQNSNIEYSYGGFLKSEIENLGVECHKGYVTDKVRLITLSEYYNISPYYKDITLPYTGQFTTEKYDNIGKIPKLNLITRVTSTEWLYSIYWWTMTAFSSYSPLPYDHQRRAYRIFENGGMGASYVEGDGGEQIRPVITILK